MKISINHILMNMFMTLVGLAFGGGFLYFLSNGLPEKNPFGDFWPFVVLAFMAISLTIIGITDLLFGGLFYKYVDVPRKDVEIRSYENSLIIGYRNLATIYHHKKDKILKLEKLKVLERYNIKKKRVRWDFVLYKQI